MKMGTNVFLTGAPGAGKTYVLNKYLDFLYKCGIEVAITASTGIAATHIGGTTIHSWAGIGIKKFLSEEDIDRLTQNERLHKRFQDTRVLVIDEISMLGAEQFETIDMLARQMRRSDVPFGGMQVVLSGDFFQLPPVTRPGDDDRYAFESVSWRELNPAICYLDTNYRHEDETLREILGSVRRQDLSGAIYESLSKRTITADSDDLREMTRLYTHNVDVDSLNDSRLDESPGKEFSYEMTSKGGRAVVESLKNWCLAPETLRLKEGVQVMFVKNDPAGRFVNGTRGVVAGKEGCLPVVITLSGRSIAADYASWIVDDNGKTKAEISQIPLRLAWAITVHKSQGMTMDEAHIDLSKAFAPGQGYVALSRVRTITGLYLSGLNEKALVVDRRALSADEKFLAYSKAAAGRLGEIENEQIEKRIKEFVERVNGKLPDEDPEEEEGPAERRAHAGVRSKVRPGATTFDKTRALVEKGLSIREIAEERGIREKTVISHIEKLKSSGVDLDLSHMLPEIKSRIKEFGKMHLAFKHTKEFRLSPIKEYLEKNGVSVDYDDLRLARLFLTAEEFAELADNG